ncbi:hypothetical protein [Bernardetia sp. MNP-M8]|uniref:hypothetical protein n=1 Tax=Bernardetia sp. MNP-M8 TaxID=3127470 RepID=UPI0030CC72C8
MEQLEDNSQNITSEERKILKEKLLKDALILKGYNRSYTDIILHLKAETQDKELMREIVAELEELDKNKKKGHFLSANLVIGLVCISAGIGLSIFLWDKGYVSTISIILIGVGLLVIGGKFV